MSDERKAYKTNKNEWLPFGDTNRIVASRKGSSIETARPLFTESPSTLPFLSLFHSKLSHSRMCFAYMSLLCIFSESKNRILKRRDGMRSIFQYKRERDFTYQACSSVSGVSPIELAIRPAFTTTQSDQWRPSWTGMNTNFFLKMSIFFFAVQDKTASGPSSLRVVMKWVVKKCTSESGLVDSPRLTLNKWKKMIMVWDDKYIPYAQVRQSGYRRGVLPTHEKVHKWITEKLFGA